MKKIKLAELTQEIQKGKESGPSKELEIEDVIDRGQERLDNQVGA